MKNRRFGRVSSARGVVCLAVAAMLLLLPGVVPAATIERVEFAQHGERYQVSVWIQIGVSAAEAFNVMTDFESWPELNSDVLKAEMVGENRLRTVVSFCVAFFCRRVELVQEISTPGHLRVVMRVLPEKSDLDYGRASWHFVPLGPNQSRVIYRAELNPAFWLPPLIDGWILRNKLKTEAIKTSKGLEREVRERNR